MSILKKPIIPSILAGCLAFGMVACSSNSASDGSGSGSDKPITIGMSVNGAAIPFYEILRQSAEDQAKKSGVKLIVSTPTDVQGQNISVNNLVSQGVDAIILAPIDARAVVPAVKRANEQKIPVITVDENSEGGDIYTYVSSPNEEGGKLAGEWIVAHMPNGGQLGIVPGRNGASNSIERTAGVMSVLKSHPQIEITTTSPGNWVTDEAFKITKPMLTAHKDIDMIFALNDGMAMGAVQAVKTIYDHEIPVIGYNGDPIAMSAIKAGQMAATVAQDPKKMAQIAIANAIAAHEGKPSPGATIHVPIHVVDKTNILSFGK